MILLQRVYDPQKSSARDQRFLVERLWPRGIRKEALHFKAWLKDAAPSTELRKWFNHDPEKWQEFQRRYFAELDARPETLDPLRKAMRQGNVTLLFSSRDTEHNNAFALKQYLSIPRKKQPSRKTN